MLISTYFNWLYLLFFFN